MSEFWSKKDKKILKTEFTRLNDMYRDLKKQHGDNASKVMLEYFLDNSYLFSNKYIIRALAENENFSDILCYAIENIESVREMNFEDNQNIAMICLLNGNSKVSYAASKFEKMCTHQDENGYNLGMWACILGDEKLAIKTMKHIKSLSQLDHDGCTLGIVATIFERPEVANEFLKYPIQVLHQDKDGFNMLMWAVTSQNKNPKLAEVVKNGLEKYPILTRQTTTSGHNIGDLMMFHTDYYNEKKYMKIVNMEKLIDGKHNPFAISHDTLSKETMRDQHIKSVKTKVVFEKDNKDELQK